MREGARPAGARPAGRAPRTGLAVTLALVALAVVVPLATGWDVHPRDDDRGFAPTHGIWDPEVGLATPFALAVAALVVWRGPALAQRLGWRWLMAATAVASATWMLALALVDGTSGLTRALGNQWEYLPTAREVDGIDGVGPLLRGWVARIPFDAPDRWVTHVAGHPPGALLFFVLLVRLGLGDLGVGLVVTALAATVVPAVLVTLRALGAAGAARTAAPVLVLTPAAVYLCVSGDAVFTAAAAWGMACLALATRASGAPRLAAWSVLAGLLLGTCVTFSYGLPLLGTICVAVLVAGRRWLPLPVAALAALVPLLALRVGGFAIWEAYPVLVERYWDGIASRRSPYYWTWGNLAALVFATGPLVGAGLAALGAARAAWGRAVALGGGSSGAGGSVGAVVADRAQRRVVALLVAGAVAAIVLASVSQMSRAEVERIWLPFVPWLSLALLALPPRWYRWALPAQAVWALLVQHLVYTSW